VTITQGFWLGDSEVTQGLWQALMGNNPSGFPEDTNRPVEQVSWDDCQIFIQKLNGQVHGLRACLPTEAQWEYACRAGTARDFAGELNAMAWYKNNAANTTHPVKGKQASPWGLYDMHGNVNEWCADWYAPEYPSGLQRDPTGAEGSSGSRRVRRGGSWNDGAVFCGTVDRGRRSPGYRNSDGGFRLAALASP
jgi:formylglycine-generating enzyme required for sulfatase activity